MKEKIDKIIGGLNELWVKNKAEILAPIEIKFKENPIELNFASEFYKPNKKDRKQCGVYVFYARFRPEAFTKEDFEKLWHSSEKEKTIRSPAFIKSRFKYKGKGKWHVIYVGKSEKVLNRLWEHVEHPEDTHTYSLKLRVHQALTSNSDLAYNYYSIGEYNKNNIAGIKFLIQNIESELRNTLSPWIGKQ